jgi:hypothetical protein
MYSSYGQEVMVKGCHCSRETEGTLRNNHWPALYFIEGFLNWISIASDGLLVSRYEGVLFKLLTIWMTNDSNNLGFSSGSDLTIDSLEEIETTSPELPSPSLVSNAMLPEVGLIEWRERYGGVTDETSSGVSVETEHKRNEEVVSIPKCFEGLLTNLGVGSRVHQDHTQEHDVSSNSTSIGVMNLNSSERSNLSSLDVKEAVACLVTYTVVRLVKRPEE